MFNRMEEEKAPSQKLTSPEYSAALNSLIESQGIMHVLVCLAGLLADKPTTCCHMDWLSSNLNVLVNRASDKNTERHGFPFGE